MISQGNQSLEIHSGFLSREEADDLLNLLTESTSWRQHQIRMFGKSHPEPRLTAWYGPAYSYSNIHWPQQELPAYLAELAGQFSDLLAFEFNAVLLNRYRHGQDGMGWHQDNEPEIDQSLIASLSLGATRKFSVKPISGGDSLHMDLHHGDALWMRNIQSDWKHQLPKTRKEVGERINLTFRRIR